MTAKNDGPSSFTCDKLTLSYFTPHPRPRSRASMNRAPPWQLINLHFNLHSPHAPRTSNKDEPIPETRHPLLIRQDRNGSSTVVFSHSSKVMRRELPQATHFLLPSPAQKPFFLRSLPVLSHLCSKLLSKHFVLSSNPSDTLSPSATSEPFFPPLPSFYAKNFGNHPPSRRAVTFFAFSPSLPRPQIPLVPFSSLYCIPSPAPTPKNHPVNPCSWNIPFNRLLPPFVCHADLLSLNP